MGSSDRCSRRPRRANEVRTVGLYRLITASIAHHFRVELVDHPYLTHCALYSLNLTHTHANADGQNVGACTSQLREQSRTGQISCGPGALILLYLWSVCSSPFVYELTSLSSLLCKLATLAVLERGFRGTAKRGKQSCAVVHWRLQRRTGEGCLHRRRRRALLPPCLQRTETRSRKEFLIVKSQRCSYPSASYPRVGYSSYLVDQLN